MVTHVQARPLAHRPSASVFQAWLRRTGRTIWRAFELVGEGRARRELTRLAVANEITNPELAAQLRQVVGQDWLARG